METGMLRRNELYRECKLDVAVDGDALTGFYIAAQTIQLAAIGGARNVPMPIARFRDVSAAFADGFNRLRAAVDEHEGKPG
jgi:hypothetical protein